jgi:hypothetical protein
MTASNAVGTSAASSASNSVTPAPATYELISTQALSSPTSSVTFSSITQSYKHLQLRLVLQSASAGVGWEMRLNGATANYNDHRIFGSNGTSSGANNSGGGSWAYVGSDFTATNSYGAWIFDILDYTNASKNPVIRGTGGWATAVGQNTVVLQSGALFTAGAVTSITILNNSSANITAGSRLSLYGVRG